MTKEQLEVIRALRHEGYAVIVWTPDELRGAKAHHVEDRSIELGHQIIEDLQEEGE
jgi:hypothetical protein